MATWPRFIIRPALFAALVLLTPLAARAQTPTVSGFAPALGVPGTLVTISGANFSAATRVQFDQTVADFIVQSSSQIQAVVPVGATTGKITVTAGTQSGSSAANFLPSPTISGFNPPRGVAGTQITINGANFVTNATGVFFNGVAATSVGVTAPNVLFATVPAGATSGAITITNAAGVAVSVTNFVVSAAPIVTDFTPLIGPIGTEVLMNGANFIPGGTTVKFNGVASGSVSVTATTQLRATVPSGATNGLISVTTANGSSTNDTVFLTGSQPLITNFFKSSTEFNLIQSQLGAPGDAVTIDGFNFLGTTAIKFNGTAVAPGGITALTANRLQCIIPAGATTGPITVVNAAGTGTSAGNFTVAAGPFATDFSPAFGSVTTTTVVINGLNFSGVTGVKFNGVAAAFNVTAPTQISATVPAGATTGPITLLTNGVTAFTTSSNFTVIGNGPFITDYSPTNGPRGTTVQINGANFTGVTAVKFGGVTAVNVFSTASSQISADVPPGALSGPIVITTPAGSYTNATPFYVPPRIAGFTPAVGASVGASVTISGTNFTGATAVTFNGVAAPFTVNSNSQITATVPTNATTGILQVTAPAGVFLSAVNFPVTPRVDSVSPNVGPAGTVVTITGQNFTGATAVGFNGLTAGFSVNSSSNITAFAPAGAGSGPVIVVTPSGLGTNAAGFTVTTVADLAIIYTNAPAIVTLGSNLVFTVTVTNKGPSIATGVTFKDTLPAGVNFVSATVSQGNFAFANNMLTANLGVLTNNYAATVTLTVRPTVNGYVNNQMNLTLAEGELNNADNFNSELVPVINDADRTLSIQFLSAPPQVVLSWPLSTVDFTLQANTNLLFTNNVWVDLPGPFPLVTNNSVITHRFTNAAILPREFFRLKSP